MSAIDASTDLAGNAAGGRKLIAVVHADMVGYSRLIGLDDGGTLARLRTLRANVIDPSVAEHGGRIVQTGGDSLLILFDSIDGAVRGAVKMQQQIPILDGDQPPDQAIRFRIGIDIGDVIADGTDFHGDGVIIATRLQAECPPGGICVSRAVYDHIHDRLGLDFEELGRLPLKNIARPIEAFALRTEVVPKRRSLDAREARSLPDKPSIAVLAFTNMSGDTEQEYFSDGIADDIITELSRSRSLFVIARSSSFTYKGRAVDVKLIARELGVRYVLEGGLRRSGDRVRLTAQLIDAENNGHIWAERYDSALEDVFAVQDEITAAIVAAVQPAVADAELRRALRKPAESLAAWEMYQRGLWHYYKATEVENDKARELFQRAIAIDPTFALAHAALAHADFFVGWLFKSAERDKWITQGFEHARSSIRLDPSEAMGHAILAIGMITSGDHEGSMKAGAEAVRLCPGNAFVNAAYGSTLGYTGHHASAIRFLERAMLLSPLDPMRWLWTLWMAVSYFNMEDYEKALR